jgi:hypothetical protein
VVQTIALTVSQVLKIVVELAFRLVPRHYSLFQTTHVDVRPNVLPAYPLLLHFALHVQVQGVSQKKHSKELVIKYALLKLMTLAMAAVPHALQIV